MSGFVVKKENTFRWPVKIPVPGENGKFKDIKVHVKFLIKDVDYIKDLQNKLNELADSDTQSQDVSDLIGDVLDDVLVGWDDGAFENEDGSPIIFSDDNKDMIVNIPSARRAIWEEYMNVIGGGKHKQKN